MRHLLRSLSLAVTLAAVLAPTAHAGGMTARFEGPAKDGTYLVSTMNCGRTAPLSATAWAEGVVNGERKSLPLKLERTRESGVYRFQHAWPREGRWLVRLAFNGRSTPAVVATLDSEGRVTDSAMVWERDGKRECDTRLAAAQK